MQDISVLFFGSTNDSLLVLDTLKSLHICAVVTQPPKPIGRKQILTPTPVQVWAKNHTIPVLSFPAQQQKPWLFANDQTVVDALQPFKADLVVSASYGQKIPSETITEAQFGGLNIHPSLLPRWRGADPVPWAIYTGDHQTGVTIVRLSDSFDQGLILAQKKLNITETDTTPQLRAKLFTMGGNLLKNTLPDILSDKIKGSPQRIDGKTPYARRLTRDDGFEPWNTIEKSFTDPATAQPIERKFRAFSPWPGVWTKIETKDKKQETKRLKILACHMSSASCLILDTVQMEGKKPVLWKQFSEAYLAP